MSKNLRLGAASIAFSQPLYIESAASIVSQKEADGPLGNLFDLVCEDPMFGCDTWESAESTLQKETATQAISKAGLSSEDIHLMFAGDLLAQTSATCFGSAGLGIPFYGLYGACSTIGEALSLGSLALTAGFGTRVLCATSSHFASAEKEFRFPLGYGNQRPFSATWTVTGSGACILSTSPPGEKAPLRSGKGCAAITGLTAGRVMDYGLRDSMNMGGCMAPAACDTIAHPQIRKGTQFYPFQGHRNCKYLKNRKIQKISQDQFHGYFRLHFQYPCQQTSCTEKYQQLQDQSGNCQYQLLHFTPSLRLLWQGFPLQPSPE